MSKAATHNVDDFEMSCTNAQGFMYALLDMLVSMGLSLEMDGNYPKMPQIAWHDNRSRFPGDTIAMAMQHCQDSFGAPARIIFVNLPTTAADLYQVPQSVSIS